MARERLIAARTARDRAVEAALELGAKDRDARLIAARQTKQLFPDVDWEQLVKPSSPRADQNMPPTPSSKALIAELEGELPFDTVGQRRPRRAAAASAPGLIRRSPPPRQILYGHWIVEKTIRKRPKAATGPSSVRWWRRPNAPNLE